LFNKLTRADLTETDIVQTDIPINIINMRTTCVILLLLALCACSKKPSANFTWSPVNPHVGQQVVFNNLSEDAKKFDWNFGDMSTGTEKNPAHTYSQAGDYTIDLDAHSGLKTDTKTETLTVLP
jgi:PKD repeat protein